MDKIKLQYESPKNKVVLYNDVSIEVSPFIDLGEQIILVNKYITDYFDKIENSLMEKTEYNYIQAEYNLLLYILELKTNLDVSNNFDISFLDTSTMEDIINQIYNYKKFRESLDRIVRDIKEEISNRMSIGYLIDTLADKAFEFLDKYSSMDEESINRTIEATKGMMKELQDIKNTGVEKVETKKRSKKVEKEQE
jgi:hypothetical protein